MSRSDSVSEPLPMAEVRASPSNVVPDRVKRIITPQEILAAVAVGGIAFWAPAEDSGLLLRLVASVLSLGGLLLATVGLELLLEYRKAAELPKTNPFEVKTRRLEVPTAPPGGVFCAACEMITTAAAVVARLRWMRIWAAAAFGQRPRWMRTASRWCHRGAAVGPRSLVAGSQHRRA